MPELFDAKVRKVGNSLALLIPKEVARKEGIKSGEDVKASVHSMRKRRKALALLHKTFGIAKHWAPFERDHRDRGF